MSQTNPKDLIDKPIASGTYFNSSITISASGVQSLRPELSTIVETCLKPHFLCIAFNPTTAVVTFPK